MPEHIRIREINRHIHHDQQYDNDQSMPQMKHQKISRITHTLLVFCLERIQYLGDLRSDSLSFSNNMLSGINHSLGRRDIVRSPVMELLRGVLVKGQIRDQKLGDVHSIDEGIRIDMRKSVFEIRAQKLQCLGRGIEVFLYFRKGVSTPLDENCLVR